MDYAQLAGRTLGQYELRSLIGKGGMSAVYRAHQPSLERSVAVKVLSKDLSTDPTYAVRFDNEAKTVATLEHNNIIPVYDYGREDDLSFIVMRLLTGGTLGERIERRVGMGAPLPSFGECVTLLSEMTKALSYAHGRGVIHRDIKASNVMFDAQGDPYLVDFGIAQVMKANLSLTAESQTIGTPTYMAPEQWHDDELTPATDQYALAILMYYMLTSHLPFYGSSSPALMQKHLNEEMPAPQRYRADIPEQAGSVLARGVAKKPEDRYVNVKAFADSFEAAFKGMLDAKTGFFTFALGSPGMKTDPNLNAPTTPQSSPEPAAYNAPTADLPEVATEELPAPESYMQGVGTPTVPAAAPVPPAQQPAPVPAAAPPPQQPASPPPAQQASTPQPQPAQQQASAPQTPPAPQRSLFTGVGIGLVILVMIGGVGLFALNALFPAQPEPATTTIAVTATPAQSAGAGATRPSGSISINPSPGATAITPVRGGTAIAAGPVDIDGSGVLYNGSATNVVRAVAVAPSGMIASAHAEGTIRIWTGGTSGSPTVLNRHSDVVNDIDISEDGSTLISGSNDNGVLVWNAQTGAYRGGLFGHTAAVRGVAVSPDGSRAVSAAEDRTVRLWDVNAGSQIATLRDGDSRFLDVDFSPDGQRIAAGDESGVIYLTDIDSRTTRTLRGHTESVRSLAFSDDGTLLVSSSTDNTIRVWSTDSGTIRATLRGHNNDVWRVAISPDGSTIASGGRDNNLRLWNVETNTEIAAFNDHAAWVLGVAFSPDGSVVVSGGGDGTIRTWEIE